MSEGVEPVARKSTKRKLLKLAYIAAGFGVGLIVIIALAFWRLSQGPVSLDYFTPALERTLAVRTSPLAVRVDKTILIWGGWRRIADLRMRNVRLLGPGEKLVALIPYVSVGISLDALLQRRFALSWIEVHGLAARVERFADGRFAFALPTDDAGKNTGDPALGDATDAIVQLARPQEGPVRDLRRIAVVDARLRYIDRKRGMQWNFPQASVSANLQAAAVEAELAFDLETEGQRTRFFGTALYDRKSRRTDGRIHFQGVRPNLLARAVPELAAISALDEPVSGTAGFQFAPDMALRALRLDLRSSVGDVALDMSYPHIGATVEATAVLRGLRVSALARSTPALASLAGVNLPVDGRIAGRFDVDGRLHPTQVDLTAGAGRVDARGVIADPVPVRGGRLRARFAPELASVEIAEAWLDVGQARLSATAKARRIGNEYRVRGALVLKDLGVGDVGRYWPLGVAENAKRWVRENISAGTVRTANMDVVLNVPVSAPSDAVVESVDGGFSYEGLNTRYWPSLPPLSGVGGTAKFDRKSLRFLVTDGHVRDVAIEQGVLDVKGLDEGKPRASIDMGLKGAARTVMQVLEQSPLNDAKPSGISAEAVSGDAVIRTQIGFPIDETFGGETVDVRVTATVRNVGMKPAPYGLAVEGGEIKIEADRHKFALTGRIRLGHLPVSVDWAEQLGTGVASRRIELWGRVPDLGEIGLGLPKLDFVAGPADARVVVESTSDEASQVRVDVDFAAAELSVPYLRWRKKRDQPGSATLRVHVGDPDGFRIDTFRVEAAGTQLEGAAAPTTNGTWRIRVDRFQRPESRLSGTVDLRSDRSVVANLHGDGFDLAPFFATTSRDLSETRPSGEPPRQVKINAALDAVSWGKTRILRQVKLSVLQGADGIEGLLLEGRTRGRGRLGVKYLPGPEGFRLAAESSDFGALLTGILPRGRIVGGSLVVRGQAASADGAVRGAFVAKDFNVREAPTLARLLQAASLTRIADAFSKKGLKFEEFEGAFDYANGRLTLTRSRAFGSSMGITLRGDIDGPEDRVALGGTLVPAYTFKRVIGGVPRVGRVMTRGKDGDLFAATYNVAGPLDKPAVSVNPLSALAPGFLRNLFGGGASAGGEADAVKGGDAAD